MAGFLRLTQILAMLAIVLSTPLIFFGGLLGLLIILPLGLFIVIAGNVALSIKTKKPLPRMLYLKYIASTLLGGLACIFGLLTAGTFANLDTTGNPDTVFAITSACIVLAFTITLLFIGYRYYHLSKA